MRHVAQNTDVAQLAELGHDGRVRVRCLVAENGHTPPEVLELLTTDSSPAVRAKAAGNPATPTAALPSLLRDPARQVRRRAIRRADVTVALLLDTLGSPWAEAVHARLAVLAAVDPAAVHALLADGRAAALHHASRGLLDEAAARVLLHKSVEQPWLAYAVATNPTTPLPGLRQLAGDHPHLSDVVATRLARDRRSRRRALLRGSPAVLAAMSSADDASRFTLVLVRCRSRHPAVTRALASQPRSPRWMLRGLSRAHRWDVRASAASNPRLPSRRVNALARGDSDWAVRAAAVRSGRLDPDALHAAARSHPAVQLYVATQPRLRMDTLAYLLDPGANPYVRAVALRNPALAPDELARRATDLTLPAWMLRSIAINPSCPPDVSGRLLTWLAIGGSPNTDATFDPLTERGHPGVRDMSEPVAAALMRMAAEPGALRHPLAGVRQRYFEHHPTLAEDHLTLLARDESPFVRRIAAGYSLDRTLRELRGDAVPWVATTAASVLTNEKQRLTRTRPGVLTIAIITFVVLVTAAVASWLSSSSTTVPPVSLPKSVALCRLPGDGSLLTVDRGAAGVDLLFRAGGAWLDVESLTASGAEPGFPRPAAPLEVPAYYDTTVELGPRVGPISVRTVVSSDSETAAVVAELPIGGPPTATCG